MPSFVRKILWVVGMNTAGVEQRVLDHARATGADGVCIRTTSPRLKDAIGRFHAAGFKVYGWRWPAVRASSVAHHFAPDEARHVAEELIPKGLDGYIVDPESDPGRDIDDWNQTGLKPLARNFCKVIRDAAGSRFAFGLTSGCKFPTNRPKIPWSEFVAASDALFPQTYWRIRLEETTNVNGGTPKKAIERGLDSWGAIADGKPIIPMAGEIDVVTADELTTYGDRVKELGRNQFHFYTDLASVTAGRLAAIKAI